MSTEVNFKRVAVIGLMFFIIYTGGCRDNVPDEVEYGDVR